MTRNIRFSVRRAIAIAGSILLITSCTTPPRNDGPHTAAADEMVLIPAGDFIMGKDGQGDCSPAHAVHIDAFRMDRYEVTNRQYLRFCEATGRRLPMYWGMEQFHCGPEFPNHPVVGVSWKDASAYAEWAGKRLPTEAEWEYAARGGLVGMNYPNGNEINPELANYYRHDAVELVDGTHVIGGYSPNGYGLYDMAGNVIEWVADWYDADYYAVSPADNPKGPDDGKFRVIRGGGWHSGPSCNRVHYRNALPRNWLDFNVGFRCAKDAE